MRGSALSTIQKKARSPCAAAPATVGAASSSAVIITHPKIPETRTDRTIAFGTLRAASTVSGIFGWVMITALLLAAPTVAGAAAQGDRAFFWIVESALPRTLTLALYAAIVVAQYLCGLATVTSSSRMVYAFARDGGLPASDRLRKVSKKHLVPANAIWAVAILTIAFAVYTPVYSTITTVCVIFLYLSYGLPVCLGLFAWGRSWTKMGPWTLGAWYRPIAVVCVFGCVLFVAIGVAPPNEKALWITGGTIALLVLIWFLVERKRFKGPPVMTGR